MAVYTTLERIEEIFCDDIEWDRPENEKKLLTPGDIFFGSLRVDNDKTFWSKFNLLETFGIATSNKQAFYMAYYGNYNEFGTLCDQFWTNKTLDLRNMCIKEMTTFNSILNTFKGAKKIILPKCVPETLLNYISAESLVFHPDPLFPLNRASIAHKEPLDITIVGQQFSFLSDPMIDMLFSFPKIKKLVLEKVEFIDASIAALTTVSFKSLTIRQSAVNREHALFLAEAILKSRNLEELNILVEDEQDAIMLTVDYLLKKLQLFKNLKNLTISMTLTPRYVRILSKCNSLENLIIYANESVEISHNKVIQILERDGLSLKINKFQDKYFL